METLLYLVAIAFGIGLLAAVGHGIWVGIAGIFRTIAGTGRSRGARPRCSRCGWLLYPDERRCPECGLERESPAATELEELKITERQLSAFHEAGILEETPWQQLQDHIATRRHFLKSNRAKLIRPTRPTAEDRVQPLWKRLEQLLETCDDVRNLTLGQRENALACYRQLAEPQIARMSVRAQGALARLLKSSDRTTEALRVYRTLLASHPDDAGFTEAALEAGTLAADRQLPELAVGFLEQALARELTPEARQNAERLLQEARAAEAAIPEVLPVVRETPAPSVPAAEPPPIIAPPPRPPRHSLGEVLAAFMEERNILWGELVGGLLVIGCSIALVIYLWKELERIPYFQFLIFVSTTALVFLAGLYAWHRLKLQTTGRGLLLIAVLLVPLNFLVMAGLTGQHEESDIFRLGTEIISLGIFAGLMFQAARAMLPGGGGPLILAVLGSSASQLVMRRFLHPVEPNPPLLLLLGAFPVACYALGTGLFLRTTRGRPFGPRQAASLFTVLGMAAFPVLVALGFLVYWTREQGIAPVLERLSVLVAVSGLPLVAGGLLVHRKLEEAPSAAGETAEATAGQRTVGTGVALGGMLVMLAAVVLAWPQPLALMLVCTLSFAVLTAVAFATRLPVAHVPALGCLAIGYLTAFHLLGGNLSLEGSTSVELMTLASSAGSGAALVFLALALGISAEWLVRVGRQLDGMFHAVGAGLVAIASLALVTARGVDHPATATMVTGLYAAGCLAMNVRWRRPWISYLGLVLVVGSTLWALWDREHALTPLWGTILALEALLMATVGTWAQRVVQTVSTPAESEASGRGPFLAFARALMPTAWRDVAVLAAVYALGLGCIALNSSALHLATAGTLAATAFMLAGAYRAPSLTWVGSALVLAGLLHACGWSTPGLHLEQPVVVAILVHATLALGTHLYLKGVERVARIRADRHGPEAMMARQNAGLLRNRLFTLPLLQIALLGSMAALAVTWSQAWIEDFPKARYAAYVGWMCGLWVVIAWTERLPLLFAFFQVELASAVLLAATAAMDTQPVSHSVLSFLHPHCLQGYGISLGTLSLMWLLARFLLRRNAVAQQLLEPPWPAVDRVIVGLLVVGQLGMAIWGVVPGVLRELASQQLSFAGNPWLAAAVDVRGPDAQELFLILFAVLVIALWERRQALAVLGLALLAVTAPVLRAGLFESQLATASALRWELALCFVICSALLWLRTPIRGLATDLGCPPDPTVPLARWLRQLLLICTVLPVLGLTVAVAVIGFSGKQPLGPLPGSFFANLGWTASNILPLAIVSAGLVGHAVRERWPGYAFAAGLLVLVSVTGGYALSVVLSRHPLGLAESVQLLQLGTLSVTLWALAWLASRPWVAAWRTGPESPHGRALMWAQLAIAAIGNCWLLLTALGLLVIAEPPLSPWITEAGSWLGWLALILTIGAVAWYLGEQAPQGRGHLLGVLGVAGGILAACSTARPTGADPWTAYHVLIAAWTATGLILLAAEQLAPVRGGVLEEFASFPSLARRFPLSPAQLQGWLVGLGLAVLLLAVLATRADPDRPYWSAGPTLALSVMAGALAYRFRLQAYAYVSGLLINLAGIMVWVAWRLGVHETPLPHPYTFGHAQAFCFAMASAVWSALEFALRTRTPPARLRGGGPPFSHMAACLAVMLLGVLTASAIISDLAGGDLRNEGLLPWLAVAMTGLAFAMTLWDPQARFSLGGLYTAGLLAVVLALHAGQLEPRQLGWTAGLALAGYVLLTAVLGRLMAHFQELPDILWIPARTEWRESWFAPVQVIVATVAVGLGVWTCFALEPAGLRWTGPLMTFLMLPAGVLLARSATGRWVGDLRQATLCLGVLVLAEMGWALFAPAAPLVWLYRSILLMTALAVMTLAYGIGLARWQPQAGDWANQGRRLGPVLGALACVCLSVVLAQEGLLYDKAQSRTPMDLWARVVVTLALIGVMASGVFFALVPGRDPLGLTERGRKLYVYAAEVLLVLLFVHVRLTIPELFGGRLGQYWTLIVMVIAFIGVGLSELFARRGLPVLAEPLQRTGIFLPILPLVAFWVRPPAALSEFAEEHFRGLLPMLKYLEGRDFAFDNYALLWFLLGLLYTTVAVTKRSFRFAFLAALAANVGLWALLYHHHLDLLTHPQMWLIPFAVILLVAEHVNRERLTEQQSGTLRYGALLMIYVSSTADMFIAGLGTSPVWPLVLAVLSVLGVLAGILLRVRAFLYLGVAFLFVVISSMIVHAAVGRGQMWVWWVAGIGLGLAIFVLFAIFEKRRHDVLRVIEEIKRWE
jgi:hypothetical protein